VTFVNDSFYANPEFDAFSRGHGEPDHDKRAVLYKGAADPCRGLPAGGSSTCNMFGLQSKLHDHTTGPLGTQASFRTSLAGNVDRAIRPLYGYRSSPRCRDLAIVVLNFLLIISRRATGSRARRESGAATPEYRTRCAINSASTIARDAVRHLCSNWRIFNLGYSYPTMRCSSLILDRLGPTSLLS